MGKKLPEPMELIIGGTAGKIDGEPYVVDGLHMFSAGFKCNHALPPVPHRAIIDSGAFNDSLDKRLSPEAALERQLTWEHGAGKRWGIPWQAEGLVSYDVLIDETWVEGKKTKQRWSVELAEEAVQETIQAARYLDSQRLHLRPRTLVLSAQGVDALQYKRCATAVLDSARPGDWFGLGGWCILGRQRSLLPSYRETLHHVIPLVAQAGITHVHIFGVLFRPAIGELQWMADQYELTTSTDSSKPALCATYAQRVTDPVEKAKKLKQSGAPYAYWRDNIAYFKTLVQTLRESPYYKEPESPAKQLFFAAREEGAAR